MDYDWFSTATFIRGGAPLDILRQYIQEQQAPHEDAYGIRALDLRLHPEASRALG
ncbi:MAG: hypothetical protein PHX60_11900 [Giesbergeria sp.]|uniref:hypothetical protein n=1 Tax=Giesbergeria sp. TaxID=2818473 RepID=UPI002624AEBB|nr:hypothetical protein [Giesbergeria sp.]MDD2610365.1 hypothetical protein [Giesbergeria sp.]